jgi:hypothetical protein
MTEKSPIFAHKCSERRTIIQSLSKLFSFLSPFIPCLRKNFFFYAESFSSNLFSNMGIYFEKMLLKDCSNISSSNLSFSLQQTLPKSTAGTGGYQSSNFNVSSSASSMAAVSSAITALTSGSVMSADLAKFTFPELAPVERLEKKSLTTMLAEMIARARKSRDQAKAELDSMIMKTKALQEENVELEARLAELRKDKEERLIMCRKEQEAINNMKVEAIKSGNVFYLYKKSEHERVENGNFDLSKLHLI